jgi:hypothetical protein
MNNTRTKTFKLCVLAGILCCGLTWGVRGATISLFEWHLNVDGTVSSSGSEPGISYAAFDFGTGLGTIMASFAGAGPHYFALYVDHEIDETINTFFNEYGAPVNTPTATQSWEIDEPGFVFGDIFVNFTTGTLDNNNGVPSSAPDDVAMALGWDFSLGAGETATITMMIGDIAPSGGFYLAQTDPDSPYSIYFSSQIAFSGVPDGGSSLACLTLALVGLGGLRRKLCR